jgi:hypothetical protein
MGGACSTNGEEKRNAYTLELNITRMYNTVILPVLYGYETWSLTLIQEYRLRVFENRVMRTMFGPKRDEVTGG